MDYIATPRSVKRRNRRFIFIYVALLAAVLVTSAAPFTYAKYVSRYDFNATAQYNKKLAQKFTLLEHAAVKETGVDTYSLDPDRPVTVQTYENGLIPKTVVPKDPHVTITGKTTVESYMYIEVVQPDYVLIKGNDLVPYTGSTSPIKNETSEEYLRLFAVGSSVDAADPYTKQDWKDVTIKVTVDGTETTRTGVSFTVTKDRPVTLKNASEVYYYPRIEYEIDGYSTTDPDLSVWQQLKDGGVPVKGPHGGYIYYFRGDKDSPVRNSGNVITGDSFDGTAKGTFYKDAAKTQSYDGKLFHIIKEDKIKITDSVPITGSNVTLTFYGYLLEKEEDKTVLKQWQDTVSSLAGP